MMYDFVPGLVIHFLEMGVMPTYNVLMILHMMFTLTINSTGWGKGHDCPPLLKSAVPMNGTSISLRPIHTQLCFVEKECHARIAE